MKSFITGGKGFVGQHLRKLLEAGWRPEYNIERTLHDVLNYWRIK